MERVEPSGYPALRVAAWDGAKLGVLLTLAYALLFLIYAGTRSALTILSVGDGGTGVLQTILATAASLVWVSLIVSVLFAVVAALFGALTALVIDALLPRFIPDHSPRGAFLVGLGMSCGIAIVFYIVLRLGMGLVVYPESVETFIFWLGLPTLIYISAGGVGGWKLARLKRQI